LLVGAAVGAGEDLKERVKALVESKADLLVVDSGHGHTKFIIEAISFIKKNYPEMVVMGGNVATFAGGKALVKAGVDILRVGMGPGSICTTRIITGMGVPQLTAIMEAVNAVEKTTVSIIADGGITQMGDMAKALAYGADSVMLGSMLAGFDESPGSTIVQHGQKFKTYRGMGSVSAMKKGGAERYGQKMESDAKKLVAEGVEGLVRHKGSVNDFLYQASGSLRSSFYYVGAKTLPEFFAKAGIVKISTAGLIESHPHDIAIINEGSNYQLKK
jgi:IMP dehydrogenase